MVANFISGIRGTTLPKEVLDGIRIEVSPVVASVASMLIVVSITTIFLLQSLKRQASTREVIAKILSENGRELYGLPLSDS